MDKLQSAILRRQLVLVTNPAVATDWIQTVASQELFGQGGWLLKCVCAELTTDTTANQQPFLIIDDGAGHVIAEGAGATTIQAVSTSVVYTWAPNFVQSGLQGATTDVHSQSPLPMGNECYLNPGWRILTHTENIGAASQWSHITLYVVGSG